MALSVQVSDIISGVRRRTDDSASKLATDTECIALVNKYYRRLYAYYAAASPDRFRTEATITSDGSQSYDLPGTWYETIGVDYMQGGYGRALERLQETDRNFFNYTSSGQPSHYRLIQNKVYLYPTPTVGLTFRHIYIPTPTAITLSNQQIDCTMGHELFLELCVSRELLENEEMYDKRWDDQIMKIENELKAEASNRYLQDMVRHQTSQRAKGYGPYWWMFR